MNLGTQLVSVDQVASQLETSQHQAAASSRADSAEAVAAAHAGAHMPSSLPECSLDDTRSTEPSSANEASRQTGPGSRQSAMPPSQGDTSGSTESGEAAAGADAADTSVSAKQTPEGISNAGAAANDVEALFARWHGGLTPAHGGPTPAHGGPTPAQPPAAKKPADNR